MDKPWKELNLIQFNKKYKKNYFVVRKRFWSSCLQVNKGILNKSIKTIKIH